MDYYFDITILPDPEIETAHLLNTLFGKLHIALVCDAKPGQVAVSFPQAATGQFGLGAVLRLHGEKGKLESFKDGSWLGALRGYSKCSNVAAIPADVKYCAVRRVQAKSNAARLRRRLMKRQSIDEKEAMRRIPDGIAQRLELPWIQLRSASTGQSFRLFIKQAIAEKESGAFNTFGLSESATVPWF